MVYVVYVAAAVACFATQPHSQEWQWKIVGPTLQRGQEACHGIASTPKESNTISAKTADAIGSVVNKEIMGKNINKNDYESGWLLVKISN